MPERVRLTKPLLRLNQGLNTEANEIQFPDGFTTDERNYELLLEGGRRRRKGLAQESGGSDKVTTNDATGDYNTSFTWYNVGGNPEKTFIVHKFGADLFFTDDAELISTTYNANCINLDEFQVTTASASMVTAPADFTSGRGYLIVSGEHMFPILVEYLPATDNFQVTRIDIAIRDYKGIDDGVALSTEPGSLDADHRYNLLNRGWSEPDIDQFFADLAKYPNKSKLWAKGYRRQQDGTNTYIDEDGVKVWNSAKLDAEPDGNSSAPLGSLIIRPSNSTYGGKLGTGAVLISGWTYVDNGATWTVTITTASVHGFSVSDVIDIDGMSSIMETEYGISIVPWSGTYTVNATPTTTTLEVTFNEPSGFIAMSVREYTLGSIGEDEAITRSSGTTLDVSVKACEFHDGRVFYAGLPDQEWSDYIFFSQVPDGLDKFEKCYQAADPTDPENNLSVETDGGYIVLQGIQGVQKLLSVRGALLVFARNGVWEIGGGQRGFFTPSGYSVRKITDVGCNSPLSPIRIENAAIYTGVEGVYIIAPNQYTSVLEANSLSEDTIQTRWNSLTTAEQQRVLAVYDNSQKRVWFLYGKTTGTGTNSAAFYYNKALILDTRIPAWTYYEYNSAQYSGIINAYAITNTDTAESANKIKFSCAVTNATTVRTCDHDQTDYVDFDGAESPLPYMVTGWDNVGDFQRRKQAPVITVFSKRTETGYVATGNGYDPVNESSSLMTAYWDWTDDAVSGKIGAQQQTYRHNRLFIPSGPTDVDGYPVVVTRNKVRGRGRVLQLRFDGEAGKDSYLLGFTTNYKASEKV